VNSHLVTGILENSKCKKWHLLSGWISGEVSGYQITINTIAPGATLTECTLFFDDYINGWAAVTPMGRPASVCDISNAALFLLSPASRYITGQSLVVDGGWTTISSTTE